MKFHQHYYRNIENTFTHSPSSGLVQGVVQHSLHVGILATPQINQSLADVTYQQSTCYWQIETEIHITGTKKCVWTNESNTTTLDKAYLWANDAYSNHSVFGQLPASKVYTGPTTRARTSDKGTCEEIWEYL